MKRIHRHLSDSQKQYQEDIERLNLSFSSELEEQYEIISQLSSQLVQVESLRKEHGEKFIHIIENAKKKYKESKLTLKHTESKLSSLKEDFIHTNAELNEVCF